MAWYWGPHLAVLALVSMFKARSAVIAGAAFGMSIYLAAFGIWALTRVHPDSMVWLGYLLCQVHWLVQGLPYTFKIVKLN
jgi:hypothetical protein